MRSKKLDPRLIELLEQPDCPSQINVIVQCVDDPNSADQQLITRLGGRLIDQFTIIPAMVVDLPPKAFDALVLSERITAVTLNSRL